MLLDMCTADMVKVGKNGHLLQKKSQKRRNLILQTTRFHYRNVQLYEHFSRELCFTFYIELWYRKTRKGVNCDELQLKCCPTSYQSFWALIMMPKPPVHVK